MPAPRGTPQIEVTFDVDGDGIIWFSGYDRCASKHYCIGKHSYIGSITHAEIRRLEDEIEFFKYERHEKMS